MAPPCQDACTTSITTGAPLPASWARSPCCMKAYGLLHPSLTGPLRQRWAQTRVWMQKGVRHGL